MCKKIYSAHHRVSATVPDNFPQPTIKRKSCYVKVLFFSIAFLDASRARQTPRTGCQSVTGSSSGGRLSLLGEPTATGDAHKTRRALTDAPVRRAIRHGKSMCPLTSIFGQPSWSRSSVLIIDVIVELFVCLPPASPQRAPEPFIQLWRCRRRPLRRPALGRGRRFH